MMSIRNPSVGKSEIVAGKFGEKARKITFLGSEKGGWVSCNFTGDAKLKPGEWVENKYKVLKLWIKGDGSLNTIRFITEHWDAEEGKTTDRLVVGNFSTEDPEWHQVVIPLEDKYETLGNGNLCYLDCPRPQEDFYFIIDHITAE